jgi:hypothetical protein
LANAALLLRTFWVANTYQQRTISSTIKIGPPPLKYPLNIRKDNWIMTTAATTPLNIGVVATGVSDMNVISPTVASRNTNYNNDNHNHSPLTNKDSSNPPLSPV